MRVIKQVAGIDVAQKELVVTLGCIYEDQSIEYVSYKIFKNTDAGIKSLIDWVYNKRIKETDVDYVMEATGVYHQKLAYYLFENNKKVYIVLPNKISSYMRTLDIKTITDKSCSRAITQFGLERKLTCWKKPEEAYNKLQQLTRERDQIVQQRSMIKNQLHAEMTQAYPHIKSIERMQQHIKFLNSQEKEIKEDIDDIITANQAIKDQIKRLTTIPGVGVLTAVTVLGETNGFELIRNKSQLSSYAGLDVKEKQSGTSVKGKPRISKSGNRNLRKCMFLPALTAVKWDCNFKEIYARLISKHGIKMKALIAIQRKLLELIYILFKNETVYDSEYKKDSVRTETVQHAIESSS